MDATTQIARQFELVFDKAGDLDFRSFVNWVCGELPDLILLETPAVGSHDKKWGNLQIFNMGDVFGQVKSAVRLSGRPTRYLKPSQWQKKMYEGILQKVPAKEKAVIAYKQLYPNEPIPLPNNRKKPHDGVLDALLIATYGVLEYGGGKLLQWRFETQN